MKTFETSNDFRLDYDILQSAIEAAMPQGVTAEKIQDAHTETKFDGQSENVTYHGYVWQFSRSLTQQEYAAIESVFAAHEPEKTSQEKLVESRLEAKSAELQEIPIIKAILERLDLLEGK